MSSYMQVNGPSIHLAWADAQTGFAAFLAYIGLPPTPQHTVDRCENGLGYVPGNVRWATAKQQARNRSSNHFLVYKGKYMSLAEAAERSGLKYSTLWMRLVARRWTVEQALETPLRGVT